MDREQAEREARRWTNTAEPDEGEEPRHIPTLSGSRAHCGDGPTMVPWGETAVELPGTGWGSFASTPAAATCLKCLRGWAKRVTAQLDELRGVKAQLEANAVARDKADEAAGWAAVKLRVGMAALVREAAGVGPEGVGRVRELMIFHADKWTFQGGADGARTIEVHGRAWRAVRLDPVAVADAVESLDYKPPLLPPETCRTCRGGGVLGPEMQACVECDGSGLSRSSKPLPRGRGLR